MSVDSKFSHKGWAAGFSGIKYPLLADFHPKGEVAKKYGSEESGAFINGVLGKI